MECGYFDRGVCRSCTQMGVPRPIQLAAKQHRAKAAVGPTDWLTPYAGAEAAFRNKAKMVVGGTVEAPTLGILDAAGHGVDLSDCGITAEPLRAAFPAIKAFITAARLVPYDVPSRRGELKHVLATISPDDELMLRFVLRSTESVPRLRKHLGLLRHALPSLRVATANILPAHAALLEGEEEIALTEEDRLTMGLEAVDLALPPRSFFQTNTEVAQALYQEAVDWVAPLDWTTAWDLYCGVGGFALHLAGGDGSGAVGREHRITGVETSAEAIAAATAAGVPGTRFITADATTWAMAQPAVPDLIVVNPPRRGLGAPLAGWLEGSGVRRVLYSSCNPATLGTDLAAMPSLRPVRARTFDMFPQTEHAEVLVLLERQG